MDFAYSLAGFFVGAVVGLTGVGGGSLMTPLLVLLFGIHPATAVGTDLLYAAITKSGGSFVHARRGTVEWRIVGLLAAGSVPASVLTLILVAHFSTEPNPRRTALLTVITGLILGTLVTISSVGAGALGVTALLFLYPKLPALRIVGSDIVHAVPLTLVAGLGHWWYGSVDWFLLGSLLVGSLPGIYLGSHLATKIPDKILRPTLAGMLVLIGGKLIATS